MSSRRGKQLRKNTGSLMPMVAFALVFTFAFLAFAVDIMREFLSVQQLRFAARAAALDLLPFASLDSNKQIQNESIVNAADGSFAPQAISNMQAELSRINVNPWNLAISNLQESEPAYTGVSFDLADLAGSLSTSSDKEDPFLRLTARRSGEQAMNFFFLPVRFAASFLNGGAAASESDLRQDIIQSIEIACQPATRIGPGADLNSSSARAQMLSAARIAVFPLALNYDDFKRAQNAAGSTAFPCILKLSNPATAQQTNANQLRAYFVNLRKGGSVSDYYYDTQNPSRVDDLIGLIDYFNVAHSATQPIQIPAAVERCSKLDRFETTVLVNPDLTQVLAQVPANHSYIIPVVREGVSPASQCEVQGFALLKLNSITADSTSCSFSFSLNQSLPLANASCAPAMKTIPAFDGTKLSSYFDSPNNPFMPRAFDCNSNSFSPRKAGMVMAPVISPRKIDSESNGG